MNKFTMKDREIFYQTLITLDESTCVAFKDKLKLLNMESYHDHKLFKNSFNSAHEKLRASRKIHYKIYMDFVKTRQILTNADFLEIFPECEYKV